MGRRQCLKWKRLMRLLPGLPLLIKHRSRSIQAHIMCPGKRYVVHFYMAVCRVNVYITPSTCWLPFDWRLAQYEPRSVFMGDMCATDDTFAPKWIVWHIARHNVNTYINTLKPKKYVHHFVYDILKCIFVNDNFWISIKIHHTYSETDVNIPWYHMIFWWFAMHRDKMSLSSSPDTSTTVAIFTMEVDWSLAKQPLKLNSGLSKLWLIPSVI